MADPVTAGDALVVCDSGSRVHAVDLASGRLRWSWQSDGPIAPPVAVAGEWAYVSGPHSAVTALDLGTGTPYWQVDHRGDWYEREYPSAASAPVVVGDLLVYRTAWGLHGLDRYTGESRWWTELFSEMVGGNADSRPVSRDGLLLATRTATDNGNVNEGSVVAIAAVDGSMVWEYTDEEVVDACPRWLVTPMRPFVAGGRAYVIEGNQLRYFGLEDGDPDELFLAAVDVATGQLLRRSALPGSFPRLTAPPVLAAGALWLPQNEPLAGPDALAPGSGAILAVDQTNGQLRFQIVLPAPPVASPVAAGGWLYLLTADHTVQVIDPDTGVRPRRLVVTDDPTPIRTPGTPGGLAAGDDWLAVQDGRQLTLITTA